MKRRIFYCRTSDPGHSSRPKSTCCCLCPLARAGPGMAASPVPRDKGLEPQLGNTGGRLSPASDPCMTQQLPSLRCARCHRGRSSFSPPCQQPHTSPCPPAPLLRPQVSACQAACDFTRDWCSWNCPWAGSMHASWKISCGESGLSEGNPLRLLLQRWSSFREATSRVLPSLGIASPVAQSWGAPVLAAQAVKDPQDKHHVPWRAEVVPRQERTPVPQVPRQ